MASVESRIEHVVVLMLENRSFDHLLGYLDHPDHAQFDGLASGAHFNVDGNRKHVPASNDGVPSGPDPDHSHAGILEQMAGFDVVPNNGGFVKSYEEQVGVGNAGVIMQCLQPETVCPVIATLAKEFAVCTRWFSSVPGETWPNRNFAHAATSDDAVDIEIGFYYDRTIFEQLTKQHVDWRVYYDGPPELWVFRKLWHRRTLIDFLLRRSAHIGSWFTQDQFAAHVQAGELAAYTFIEPAHNHVHEDRDAPRQTSSQHPHNNVHDDHDFRAGEDLIRNVYRTLLANRELFDRTLLVITYDEHGGLYDHVKPPGATPPGDPIDRALVRRIAGFVRSIVDRRQGRRTAPHYDFKQLGVRVPAILVSPWIAPGSVVGTRLEHASIPKTVRTLFLREGTKSLTHRDEAANPFHDVVRTHGLAEVRPDPGGAGPALPSLAPTLAATAPAPRAEATDRPTATSRSEQQFDHLADQVERKLRRTRAAPSTTPPARAPELFAATAHAARHRGLHRPR